MEQEMIEEETMIAPTWKQILIKFLGDMAMGAIVFAILMALAWGLGVAIDKQAQIDEAQRAEVVRL